MKSLAVIVTHNRSELLKRCISSVMQQTLAVNEILVVNNGSTDNTISVLEDLGIKYITQDNVGSAGGWFTGLEYAIEHEFTHAWLMDDDGFPDSNAFRCQLFAD